MSSTHFKSGFIYRKLPPIAFILALTLFIMSMTGNSHEGNTERIAQSTASKIEKRLAIQLRVSSRFVIIFIYAFLTLPLIVNVLV